MNDNERERYEWYIRHPCVQEPAHPDRGPCRYGADGAPCHPGCSGNCHYWCWHAGDLKIIPTPRTITLAPDAVGRVSTHAAPRRTLNLFPVGTFLGYSAFDGSVRFRLPERTGEELPFCRECREPDGHHDADCTRGRIEAALMPPFNVKRIGPEAPR